MRQVRSPKNKKQIEQQKTEAETYVEALLRRMKREEKNNPRAVKPTPCLCSSRTVMTVALYWVLTKCKGRQARFGVILSFRQNSELLLKTEENPMI